MDRINCKSQYSHLHPAKFPPQSVLPWALVPVLPQSHPSGETRPTPLSLKPPVTLFFCTEDLQGDHFYYPPDNNPLVVYTIPGHTKSLAAKNPSILGEVHAGTIWRNLEILQEKSFLIHSWRAVDAKWMAMIAGFFMSSQFRVQVVKASLLSKPTLSSLSVSSGLGTAS